MIMKILQAVIVALIIAGIASMLFYIAVLQAYKRNEERKGVKVEDSRIDKKIKFYTRSAGIDTDPQTFKFVWFVCIAAAASVAYVLIKPSIIVALIGATIGVISPTFYIKKKRADVRSLFEEQLGISTPILASSLRSGSNIQAALQSYAENAEEPIRTEYLYCRQAVKLGTPLSQAFEQMGDRMQSESCYMLAVVIKAQEANAANLADIIENVGRQIQEKQELNQMIQSSTVDARKTAKTVTLVPFGTAVLLMFMVPSIYKNFYTTWKGALVGLVAALIAFYGYRRIMKIIDGVEL